MYNSLGMKDLNRQRGFTVVEVLFVTILIGILCALAIKPMNGFIQRIKLQNAAEGMKHYILNARMRAVSNSNRHCGVIFDTTTSVTVAGKATAFFDTNPADYIYTAGSDPLYASANIIAANTKIKMTLPSGVSTVVFRGDGSANVSTYIIFTLNNFKDSLSILASTGKVKVTVK